MGKKITKIDSVKHSRPLEHAAPRRVCAYCRVSTGSAEQRNSFEAQVQYYTRLIGEKPNWVLVGIYADEARSGTKVKRREGFQQMIGDCRQGKIDLILTKSVTRFARNTVDSIQTIRMLKGLGIEVYFEKERVGTLSEKSEQLLTILSSIAQGEAESISTNNRWSILRRFQNGTYTVSCPAYGYRNDENGNLVPYPAEAAIVRRIFDEYLGGKGSYAIAKDLQKEGIPTSKTAESWQDSVVKWILQNPVYAGLLGSRWWERWWKSIFTLQPSERWPALPASQNSGGARWYRLHQPCTLCRLPQKCKAPPNRLQEARPGGPANHSSLRQTVPESRLCFPPFLGPRPPISIHAPREGSDRRRSLWFDQRKYFNPRSPRGERR